MVGLVKGLACGCCGDTFDCPNINGPVMFESDPFTNPIHASLHLYYNATTDGTKLWLPVHTYLESSGGLCTSYSLTSYLDNAFPKKPDSHDGSITFRAKCPKLGYGPMDNTFRFLADMSVNAAVGFVGSSAPVVDFYVNRGGYAGALNYERAFLGTEVLFSRFNTDDYDSTVTMSWTTVGNTFTFRIVDFASDVTVTRNVTVSDYSCYRDTRWIGGQRININDPDELGQANKRPNVSECEYFEL